MLDRPLSDSAVFILNNIYAGTRHVTVNSPPGAGKTQTVASVVYMLMCHDPGLSVVVAARTRLAVAELESRCRAMLEGAPIHPDRQLCSNGSWFDARTLASLVQQNGDRDAEPMYDIAIVDEAYQETFARVSAAVSHASQVVLIGDPGQIGPVVSTASSPSLDTGGVSPALPGAAGFALLGGGAVGSMQHSYRLGQVTVDAIAPLYSFPFESRRPPRCVDQLPEIVSIELGAGSDVMAIADFLARLAGSYVGRQHFTEHGVSVLEPKDICIGVANNVFVNTVEATLSSLGLGGVDGVTVSTADKLQGKEWPVFIGLDPLAGQANATAGHHLSAGRLCVLASRHSTHLAWVFQPGWADMIELLAPENADANFRVREFLCR